MLPELGKVAPYGVYDIAANVGWINLGITSDTAAFAVESIRRWWHELGPRYQDAKRVLVTADCGGSNGARVRLWKTELQTLADRMGLSITVAHLPPGTRCHLSLGLGRCWPSVLANSRPKRKPHSRALS